MPMMALLNSRTNEEMRLERERKDGEGKGNKGQSLTEQYLETIEGRAEEADPLAMAKPEYDKARPQIVKRKNPEVKGASPDGLINVPGLVKPRTGIGRRA